MSRILLWASGGAAAEVESMLARSWEVVCVDDLRTMPGRAAAEPFDAVLLLPGAIADHEDRVAAVAALRRYGFAAPILVAGSFLTERDDAIRAGADYVFDPARQAIAVVVRAALRRVRVAADHPYLRALLVGEWADASAFDQELPAKPPDLLLVSTCLHARSDFWSALASFRERHEDCTVVIVEDGGDEDTIVEAVAAGADHYVELVEKGIGALLTLCRSVVRGKWLARIAAA